MDADRLAEKLRESPALQELVDRLSRCTHFIIQKGLENTPEQKTTIESEDLWKFDIDSNHDDTIINTLTAFLCERPEVEQLEADGHYRITIKPEAYLLHGRLPGFIQQILPETINEGVYLDAARVEELTGIDIRQDDSRELFFSMLDDRPEVTSWFYDEDLSGIGVDFASELCHSPQDSEPENPPGLRL